MTEMQKPDMPRKAEPSNVAQSFWDGTITLRQIRKWFLILSVLGLLLYVWQFFRYVAHSEMGGGAAKLSPYFEEIPENCRGASDRHLPTNSSGMLVDKFVFRLRPLRIPSDKYLNPDYARIRCLGYAVLTGLHTTDPLDANFTDTYVDVSGKPIVRISVEYLQPYFYSPSQHQPIKKCIGFDWVMNCRNSTLNSVKFGFKRMSYGGLYRC